MSLPDTRWLAAGRSADTCWASSDATTQPAARTARKPAQANPSAHQGRTRAAPKIPAGPAFGAVMIASMSVCMVGCQQNSRAKHTLVKAEKRPTSSFREDQYLTEGDHLCVLQLGCVRVCVQTSRLLEHTRRRHIDATSRQSSTLGTPSHCASICGPSSLQSTSISASSRLS